MYYHKKHFSLDEAQGLLKKVRPDIEKMVYLKQQLDKMGYDVYKHTFFGGIGPNGEGFHPPELEDLVKIIQSIVAQGIQIKGIDTGLIDFPHIRHNGEEVYLCWKINESKIEYWHRISDGYKGRRHINEL